jgi:hypothetical protein
MPSDYSFWQSFYTQPTGYNTSITLENNKTYLLYTYYNGKYYSVNIPLSKTNFTMPNVSGLSGTATFNPSTNTITVNGIFEIDC